MMKKSTVQSLLEELKSIEKSELTISAYCKKNNISVSKYYDSINVLREEPYDELTEEVIHLYDSLLMRKAEDTDTDDRAVTNIIRDENGKISKYYFKIFRRDKTPVEGYFSRDEMNNIYRMYSYYGASLTQRQVSRLFPEYTLVDFKRILRAFNITKASACFAPHILEEHTQEELLDMQFREKENNFLKKIEENRVRDTEILLKQYAKENYELKDQLNNRDLFISTYKIDPPKSSFKVSISNSTILPDTVVILSDLHIGAYNEKYGYLQLEDYNKDEILRRLYKVIESLSKYKHNSITICNLGDSLDSFNKETTRGGHELPSILSNKEQSKLYHEIMNEFFYQLSQFASDIKYICVGESNHDGDWGWINNLLLAQHIKQTYNIDTYISNNPIDYFNIQDVSIIYLHGKDNKNQFKGFPLVINDKTESWFNNYLLDSNNDYKSKKCIIKGDLHQFAYSCAKHFDYISAPSVYGSSNWIVSNFGKTPWGVLVLNIINNNIINYVIKDA